jgi:hypothetical protein
MNRARNAAHVASDVVDMAETVLGAARRFGFRRKADRHPVESTWKAAKLISSMCGTNKSRPMRRTAMHA